MNGKYFTIYTKPNCIWCDRAKMFLDEKKLTYVERNIDNSLNKTELLQRKPDAKTVPQIWYGDGRDADEHIGGYDMLGNWCIKNGI